MRHKLTIEVDEGFVTRITVDGTLVGLVRKFEISAAIGDPMPKGSIELLELDKPQQDTITALKEIPWLKVDSHQ